MKWLWSAAGLVACAGSSNAPGVDVLSAAVRDRSVVGEIVLRCSHRDAEVLVDGVPQGRCDDFSGHPRGLRLAAGLRHVRVEKSGFVSWETWVQPERTKIAIEVELMARGGN